MAHTGRCSARLLPLIFVPTADTMMDQPFHFPDWPGVHFPDISNLLRRRRLAHVPRRRGRGRPSHSPRWHTARLPRWRRGSPPFGRPPRHTTTTRWPSHPRRARHARLARGWWRHVPTRGRGVLLQGPGGRRSALRGPGGSALGIPSSGRGRPERHLHWHLPASLCAIRPSLGPVSHWGPGGRGGAWPKPDGGGGGPPKPEGGAGGWPRGTGGGAGAAGAGPGGGGMAPGAAGGWGAPEGPEENIVWGLNLLLLGLLAASRRSVGRRQRRTGARGVSTVRCRETRGKAKSASARGTPRGTEVHGGERR